MGHPVLTFNFTRYYLSYLFMKLIREIVARYKYQNWFFFHRCLHWLWCTIWSCLSIRSLPFSRKTCFWSHFQVWKQRRYYGTAGKIWWDLWLSVNQVIFWNNFHKNLQLINYKILFRDTFLYAASVDSRGLDATVEILGEVVLRPQITDDELKMVFYLLKNSSDNFTNLEFQMYEIF